MSSAPLTTRSQQTWLLALACFAGFMSGLDLNIVRLAMPRMSEVFHVDAGIISWVQILYILVLTCLLLVFGKLGDRWGYRPIFLSGIAVFTGGSVLCAVSEQIEILLAARALQAAGGAAMLALTTPLVSTLLPHGMQGNALGLVSASESLGITLGRFLGGVIVQYFDWQWIFLINVPVGVAALVVGFRVLPHLQPARREQGFDFVGAGLLFATLGPLLFAISMSDDWGWTSPAVVGALIVAALGLPGFVLVETRSTQPLLDLSIFNPNLVLAFATSFVKYFIESGLYFLVPFYLMLEKKMSPTLAGLIMVVPAGVQMCISVVTGWLSGRLGARALTFISMMVTSLSCALFVLLGPESGIGAILIAVAAIGVAKGLFIAPNRHRVMESAPEGKLGSVNGALETTGRAGVAFGICSFETVFSSYLPDRGASYLHASEAVLQYAFRSAFVFGLAVSVVGIVTAGLKIKRASGARELTGEAPSEGLPSPARS